MVVNKNAFLRFEGLEHDKENGFYDVELDMYFEDLGEWLKYNGYGWKDVTPGEMK